MRLKTLYLIMAIFLIGAAALSSGEALSQVGRQTLPPPPQLPPVGFPPFTRTQPPTTIPNIPSIQATPQVDTRMTAPQVSVPAAAPVTQSGSTAVTSVTPPPDEGKPAEPDAGDSTPTPSPEITPTVTPEELSLEETLPESIEEETPTDDYISESPSPTATPSPTPTPENSSSDASDAFSVWLWRIVPISAGLFIIWALYRRSTRY
jgi:hypothetical protein